jgi:8-oxo-dGTP pyrophosphatase MutT (NUDIX family)
MAIQSTFPTMNERWNPSVTVAAVIEKDGRYLLIEEHTQEGLRLNNPAGHLDPGESLIEACARECLEETAHPFEPKHLVGIYQSRFHRAAQNGRQAEEITYLRFAFTGNISHPIQGQALDHGIVQVLWMTLDEVRSSKASHRSPLVLKCIEDHAKGQRFPMDLIHTDLSVWNI